MRLENGSTSTGALRVEIGGGSVRGTKDLRDGQWHHVAGVLPTYASPDATNILLYVDGVLEPLTSSVASPINTDSASATIGVDSQSRYFTGVIDEARIYDRALSASEIASLNSATNQSAAAWFRRYFGDASPTWNVDDDGDGGMRLLEYAMGAEPLIPDANLMKLAASLEGNVLQVRFPRRVSGTHELLYTLQSSSNLTTWNPIPAGEINIEPGYADGFETATYGTNLTDSATQQRYLRLKVAWQ